MAYLRIIFRLVKRGAITPSAFRVSDPSLGSELSQVEVFLHGWTIDARSPFVCMPLLFFCNPLPFSILSQQRVSRSVIFE